MIPRTAGLALGLGSRLGLGLILATAASFGLSRVHPFGDAGLFTRSAAPAVNGQASIPPNVRALLAAKCADCHSLQTRAPFYGHFAPVSWLLERDIVEARRHMDLSHWDSYSADQQQTLIAKIVQQTRMGEMPPLQYRVIHWSSRISAADLQVLTAWANAPRSGAGITNVSTTPGNPIRGAALFERRCTGCHSLMTNREGPNLQGVYGRPTGAVANFPYSATLKGAHLHWNDRSLEQWLTDPDAFLPGNNMDFRVTNPQERQDLIAWFRQSAAK